jgi:hypothetical protein
MRSLYFCRAFSCWVSLLGFDFDAETSAGLGVLGDDISRDTEILGKRLPVNGADVGLNVKSLESIALEGAVTRKIGRIFKVVLDGVSLGGKNLMSASKAPSVSIRSEVIRLVSFFMISSH